MDGEQDMHLSWSDSQQLESGNGQEKKLKNKIRYQIKKKLKMPKLFLNIWYWDLTNTDHSWRD